MITLGVKVITLGRKLKTLGPKVYWAAAAPTHLFEHYNSAKDRCPILVVKLGGCKSSFRTDGAKHTSEDPCTHPLFYTCRFCSEPMPPFEGQGWGLEILRLAPMGPKVGWGASPPGAQIALQTYSPPGGVNGKLLPLGQVTPPQY